MYGMDIKQHLRIVQSKIIGTTDGYRVQVISTDDIDEANLVRSELYEKTTRKEVYIVFEPPFYKVKVGDFTSKSEAENLTLQTQSTWILRIKSCPGNCKYF